MLRIVETGGITLAKAKSTDWRNRNIKDWNVTTFSVWFSEMVEVRYGVVKYLPFKNWSAEKGMLNRMIKEHGQDVVKDFLEACLKVYKPQGQYLHLTIGFAISYMQNPHLHKVLNRYNTTVTASSIASTTITVSTEGLEDWF